jgi:flavin reductase (DIM6/NTAB) family NADH-FMN oxidoreductase RutF
MTGVTVITTHDQQNNFFGFTANSFTSVSLEPPLVLVCIDNNSENIKAYINGAGFAVNVLSAHQQDLSKRFSTPTKDRFADLNWTKSDSGHPIIDGVAAYFDCTLNQTIKAGDHTIMIGGVQSCWTSRQAGLGYSNGKYFTLS